MRDDLQQALETESRLPLRRFFERWICGDTLPRLRMASRIETVASGDDLVVRLEQAGEVFDVPLTLTVDCTGCPPVEVNLRLVDARQEIRIPLKGQLRRVDLNRVHVVPLSDLVITDTIRVTPPPASARPPRPR